MIQYMKGSLRMEIQKAACIAGANEFLAFNRVVIILPVVVYLVLSGCIIHGVTTGRVEDRAVTVSSWFF